MIQLDETGAQYVQIPSHPYFYQEEPQWDKPAYQSGGIASFSKEQTHSQNIYTDETINGKKKLWPFIRT